MLTLLAPAGELQAVKHDKTQRPSQFTTWQLHSKGALTKFCLGWMGSFSSLILGEQQAVGFLAPGKSLLWLQTKAVLHHGRAPPPPLTVLSTGANPLYG